VLGAAGAIGGRHRSKNDVQDFQRSSFVRKVADGTVQFDYDIRPKKLGLFMIFYPPYFFGQRRANKTMHKVPVEHAVWIGAQHSQLSDEQLREGFRAAGYNRSTTESYVRVLRSRINQLTTAGIRACWSTPPISAEGAKCKSLGQPAQVTVVNG